MRKKQVRQSKTVAQQCRYYEVENIFDYMVETYINGNRSTLKRLYKKLRVADRQLFIRYCFNEMNPSYIEEIINIVAN